MIGRRALIAGSAAALAVGCGPAREDLAITGDGLFDDLARKFGGGIGIAALDTGSGRRIDFDSISRYAMCSTFKLPLAGMILARNDAGVLQLDEEIGFGPDDMVPYAPVTERFLDRGAMTIAELCEAAVTLSDNVAANLLLRRIGGPGAFTQWLRSIGDTTTRLDRIEPALNSNLPGDPRDTTTPGAMLDTVNKLVLGNVLAPASRAGLAQWAVACETGDNRLRAGLPDAWRIGDKTGTSANGAANDVAIVWPPERPPFLIACFIDCARVTAAERDAGHAEVARRILREFS
ncbi:class A beta-lactamase [Stakelama tenebrarum]|uniref:Beta-lactamase n=1 Tax=Stakelama tenebrarum TaxID=2711215 RepID=A0A6G6Y6X7_9SPHN|nr:class A beta-lactamase [Sphingosinithalassobacter tenebrarum]QIG80670.1 class A beta-lactamase [Sphingosinithalassobacter tenebrarum]